MYTIPTAAEFKARFPEFSAVGDDLITLVIAESEPSVGETWLDTDRRPAVMYLTAHKLFLQGQGPASGGAWSIVSGPMTRRKVGDVEVQYAGTGGAAGIGSGSASEFARTIYGVEYWRLLRRNFSGTFAI